MHKLQNTSFLALLPSSINEDATVKAAAASLDAVLQSVSLSIPNVLLYARLLHTAGYTDTAKKLLPALSRLVDTAGGLQALGMAEVEQLAWQFHVDFRDTAPDKASLARMVVDSIPWHRIKGTPESMRRAFALHGMDAVVEEGMTGDAWATYQLGLPSVASMEEVQKITDIAYATHPARCSLFRIYTDIWDVRPAGYDIDCYDVAAYDLYSGVSVSGLPDGSDLLVSFGRMTSTSCEPVDIEAFWTALRLRGTVARHEDTLMYDVATYDTTLEPACTGFSRSRLRTITFGDPIYEYCTWEEPPSLWNDKKWCEIIGYTPTRDACAFTRRSIACMEAVYDEAVYDTLHAHYEQPLYTKIIGQDCYDMGLYDDTAYDDGAWAQITERINAWKVRIQSATSSSVVHTNAVSTFKRTRTRLGQNILPPVLTWQSGTWTDNIWQAFGAYTKSTKEYAE